MYNNDKVEHAIVGCLLWLFSLLCVVAKIHKLKYQLQPVTVQKSLKACLLGNAVTPCCLQKYQGIEEYFLFAYYLTTAKATDVGQALGGQMLKYQHKH